MAVANLGSQTFIVKGTDYKLAPHYAVADNGLNGPAQSSSNFDAIEHARLPKFGVIFSRC